MGNYNNAIFVGETHDTVSVLVPAHAARGHGDAAQRVRHHRAGVRRQPALEAHHRAHVQLPRQAAQLGCVTDII